MKVMRPLGCRRGPHFAMSTRCLHANSEIATTSLYHLTPPSLGTPILVNSPHSGTFVPPSFSSPLRREQLRETEDSFVDELWLLGCEGAGAGLMAASFPRWYIDLNRREDDIDPELLLPEEKDLSLSKDSRDLEVNPGPKTFLGLGLIRRLAAPGAHIYDQPLSRADVMHRIDHYYKPYHRRLREELESVYKAHGHFILIDAHSMKSVGNKTTPDVSKTRPDVVLGDLKGRSCDPWVTETIVKSFRSHGLSVQVNDPYAGAHIMTEYGRPHLKQHSIQIEINRSLYMDEKTRVRKNAGLQRLQLVLLNCLKNLKAGIR